MEHNEAIDDILNDLMQANNDRIAVYERAINDLSGKDRDLRLVFGQMILQSVKNKKQLAALIEQNEGIVEDKGSALGKIHSAWMVIKSRVSGMDHKGILESCEYSEYVALKAYETALSDDELRDDTTRRIIAGQHTLLKIAHNIIKQHRNVYIALNNDH